jgi:integrase
MATSSKRVHIDKTTVEGIKPGLRDRYLWDTKIPGFGCKVTPPGAKVFIFQYRFPRNRAGRVRRITIGTFGDALTVSKARNEATTLRGQVFGVNSVDPYAAKAEALAAYQRERSRRKNTFAALSKEFIELYARPNNRSAANYERILRTHVIPIWGTKPVDDIRRKDVAALLNGIVRGTNPGTKKKTKKQHKGDVPHRDGRAMAHYVLAVVRKVFQWHQAREETFVSPVVPGMSPLRNPRERARDRILSDDEIRKVWHASEVTAPPYGSLIRFLLLTAQRREEATKARRSEIEGDIWTIPAERYKTKRANMVPLSAATRELLDALPCSGPYIFGAMSRSPRGMINGKKEREADRPFTAFSKSKRKLDEASGVTGWTIHDLRRTARTLLVRTGVRPDVAERVLGHAIAGVAGTYDRHDYLAEKRHALDALAGEVARILEPSPSTVIVLSQKGKAR